jgi:hypothetical protein
MAAGVPVACSNTTSLPEVAADAAILFDPRVPTQIAQAMISMVADESLRTKLVGAGLRRASEFSDAQRMAHEYWELFQRANHNGEKTNQMVGIYTDGWVGSNLKLQIAPAKTEQHLEIEFSAPDWLPHPRVTVSAQCGVAPRGTSIVLKRGSGRLFSISVGQEGGAFEICINPTFVPAHLSATDDQRELSLLVKRCHIVADNANRIELFAEKQPA